MDAPCLNSALFAAMCSLLACSQESTRAAVTDAAAVGDLAPEVDTPDVGLILPDIVVRDAPSRDDHHDAFADADGSAMEVDVHSDVPPAPPRRDAGPWAPRPGYGLSLGMFTRCVWRPDATWCWGDIPVPSGAADAGLSWPFPPTRISGVVGVAGGRLTHSAPMILLRGASDGVGWSRGSSVLFGGVDFEAPTTLTELPWLRAARDVAATDGFAAIVTSTGELMGFGITYDHELGRNFNGSMIVRTPIRVNDLTGVVQVATGARTCALLDTGRIACWGRSRYGELGAGYCEDGFGSCYIEDPVINPYVTDAVEVGVGGVFTCARLRDGRVDCWGFDGEFDRSLSAHLGAGRVRLNECYVNMGQRLPAGWCTNRPIQVRLPRPAVRLSVGSEYSCAIVDDGTLWCWGTVWEGAFGPGTPRILTEPMRVPGLTDVIDVSVESGSCALERSGAVWCWGSNSLGQMGTGTRESRTYPPTRIPLPADW